MAEVGIALNAGGQGAIERCLSMAASPVRHCVTQEFEVVETAEWVNKHNYKMVSFVDFVCVYLLK